MRCVILRYALSSIFLTALLIGLARGDIILQADFEEGDLSDVETVACPIMTTASAAGAKSGNYGMQIAFDSAFAGSGDINCGAVWDNLSVQELSHFWVSMWFKLDESIDAGVSDNRKLIYIWGVGNTWDLILKADGTSYPVDLLVASNCHTDAYFCVERISSEIYGNTWYFVELEVQLNTDGNSDGFVRLYLDGASTPTTSWENVSISADTNELNKIRFGAQQEGDYPTPAWTEYRWIDDIAISTTRLTDTTSPTVTSATINGFTVTVNFDETVVTTGYDANDFNLDCSVSGNDIGLSSPSGSGSSRTFTVASSIAYGETCNLDYVGITDDIEDAAGNDLATFSNTAVTNNTPAPQATATISGGSVFGCVLQ